MGIVSGQHDQCRSQCFQITNSLNSVFLDDIGHGNHPGYLTVHGDDNHRFGLTLQAISVCLNGMDIYPFLLH